MLGLGLNPASAMESPSTALGDGNSIAQPTSTLKTEDNDSQRDIVPFAGAFTISDSSLGPNQYKKSAGTYYLKKGDKIKIKSVTWSPSGQKVQLGFINATTGQ